MVRVGGGWVALEEFLLKNDPCRAKGRTNIELREQFILADGVSQTMAAFKSKPHSAQQSPGSASPVYRGSPGPITKVRERSQRSVAMGKTRKSSLSAGTPDSLSDNEGSLSNSLSYGASRYTPRRTTTSGVVRSTTLTPGGSRGGSKPNSRPASRAGSKPPSRHGSDLSLDSTDGTPSRIPMRRKISDTTTPRPTRLSVGMEAGIRLSTSRPRTPSGSGLNTPTMSRSGGMSRASSIPTLTASMNSQSRIPVPVRHHSTSDPPGRNASGSTTPTSTLRKGETTPGGSQRNVSIFESTVTTTRSSGTTPSTGTNGRRRPIPMDQRAPFR